MCRTKDTQKRFGEFVDGLSVAQCRRELTLAYTQMECCIRALKGEDVEPVEMMDNGESTDLELFYACVKHAEELAYLNGMAASPKDDCDEEGQQ